MPSRSLMLFLLMALACLSQPIAAAPAIVGAWTLDEKASADPEKIFKGKHRHQSEQVPTFQNGGERGTPYDLKQLAYWDSVREGKETRPIKDLRHLGIAYPMVKAQRLDIIEEDGGYRMDYDSELPRSLRPNPNGKVFSAKGDELVQDSFGYTLTYWDKDSLVIEADAPEGGKVTEKFTVRENPHQLEYIVRVQLRMQHKPIEIKRLFNPAH